jgi:2-amino-4-hydroxy-6-hydroxymethyldihydropteridine diphosphokinase
MNGLAAVGLGSNLESRFGDRRANLLEAVERIRGLGEVRVVSSFYDTEPVGYVSQPRFLNAALLLATGLEPEALMRGLLGVEESMGRRREGVVAKGPRVIDLDLLLYGQVAMTSEELVLPHPALQERRFVLEPLVEIAPEMVHPVLGLTVGEMLARLSGDESAL